MLLGLTGCGTSAPEPVGESRSGCLVSAPTGFDDSSAGALTLQEMELARAAGVFSATSSQRVSNTGTTSAALGRMVDADCALTAVIGPGGAQALADAAEKSPDDVFLGVATGFPDFPDNVLTLDFDLVAVSFMAGYIAATASETGEVGILVAHGFPQGEKLLAAFDAGVDLYNKENKDRDGRVSSFRAETNNARMVSDTPESGADYFSMAEDSDVDVLLPFGAGAAAGVAEATIGARTKARAAQKADDAEDGSAGSRDDADTAAEADSLPKLIWYGRANSFGDASVATIEPNIRRGLRTMFPDWPQSKNPDEVPAAGAEDPEDVGGFAVADKHYEGDLDNGGVGISAEDGFLSRVSDAGRSIADLRERIKSGDITPTEMD